MDSWGGDLNLVGAASLCIHPWKMLTPFQSRELMFRNKPYLQTNSKVFNSWGSRLLRKLVYNPAEAKDLLRVTVQYSSSGLVFEVFPRKREGRYSDLGAVEEKQVRRCSRQCWTLHCLWPHGGLGVFLLVMMCYMDIKAPTVCLAQASVVPNGEGALFYTLRCPFPWSPLPLPYGGLQLTMG